MSISCSKIRPASTFSKPAIRFNVVDLPQPDGPSSETNVSLGISIDRSSTARVPPKILDMLTSETCAKRCLQKSREADLGQTSRLNAFDHAPNDESIERDRQH